MVDIEVVNLVSAVPTVRTLNIEALKRMMSPNVHVVPRGVTRSDYNLVQVQIRRANLTSAELAAFRDIFARLTKD